MQNKHKEEREKERNESGLTAGVTMPGMRGYHKSEQGGTIIRYVQYNAFRRHISPHLWGIFIWFCTIISII